MRDLMDGTVTDRANGPLDDQELLERTYGDRSPTVRWNMVSTLDGSAVGADGRSGSINSEADHLVFGYLRGWAQVVLVGASTATAEHYGPLDHDDPRTGARRPGPLLVVLARDGTVPDALQHADPARVQLWRNLDPQQVITRLRSEGFERILFEGGPRLAGAFLRAGCIDELCLTLSPLLVGGEGPRILLGDALSVTPRLASMLEQDGTLLTRWTL